MTVCLQKFLGKLEKEDHTPQNKEFASFTEAPLRTGHPTQTAHSTTDMFALSYLLLLIEVLKHSCVGLIYFLPFLF